MSGSRSTQNTTSPKHRGQKSTAESKAAGGRIRRCCRLRLTEALQRVVGHGIGDAEQEGMRPDPRHLRGGWGGGGQKCVAPGNSRQPGNGRVRQQPAAARWQAAARQRQRCLAYRDGAGLPHHVAKVAGDVQRAVPGVLRGLNEEQVPEHDGAPIVPTRQAADPDQIAQNRMRCACALVCVFRMCGWVWEIAGVFACCVCVFTRRRRCRPARARRQACRSSRPRRCRTWAGRGCARCPRS